MHAWIAEPSADCVHVKVPHIREGVTHRIARDHMPDMWLPANLVQGGVIWLQPRACVAADIPDELKATDGLPVLTCLQARIRVVVR